MMTKSTIGHTLGLPLGLAVDKIACFSHQEPSFCAESDNQKVSTGKKKKKKTSNFIKSHSYPLEHRLGWGGGLIIISIPFVIITFQNTYAISYQILYLFSILDISCFLYKISDPISFVFKLFHGSMQNQAQKLTYSRNYSLITLN